MRTFTEGRTTVPDVHGRPRLWAGTSGWQYKHWRGDFYPEGVPVRRWLEHYADHFDAVEVNSTFYGLPKASSVERWTQQVPPDFLFTIKMWRGITHYRKLQETQDLLVRFFDAIAPVAPYHLAPVLVQLPPNFGKNVGRLEVFLDDCRRLAPKGAWHWAFEFRHPSWLDQDVFDLLSDFGAVPALHDMTRAAPNEEPGDADWVYLRRHGPGGDMGRGYTPEAIAADARRVEQWINTGRTVFAYYNNDVHGHAPRDAQALVERVGHRSGGEAVHETRPRSR